MRAIVLLLVVASVAGSGCAGVSFGSSAPAEPCEVPKALLIPADGRLAIQGENRIDLLFLSPDEASRFSEVRLPPKWKWMHTDIGNGTLNGTFLRVSIQPAGVPMGTGRGAPDPSRFGMTEGLSINWTSAGAASGACVEAGHGSFPLQPDFAAGAQASSRGGGAAGKGAYVRYAGFYTNGTLFGTNIKAVDDVAGLPRAGFYKFGTGEPLSVYIYDKDRQEGDASPLWNPKDPQGGYPAWRYFSTIRGFNEALKGLPPLLPKVVVVEPKDAYPNSGALKGERLVFYVVLEETVDMPCASQLPSRNVCRAPRAADDLVLA